MAIVGLGLHIYDDFVEVREQLVHVVAGISLDLCLHG